MERKRRRKDAPDIGENPFLVSFENDVVTISKDINLSDIEDIEINEDKATGLFGDSLRYKKSLTYERDEFLLEYVTHRGVRLFNIKAKLPAQSRLLYDYIKDKIKKNSTCVYVDKVEFMEIAGMSSNTTYIATKSALIKANIIAPSSSVFYGWYWINPEYFFKGFRADVLKGNNVHQIIDLDALKAAREKKAEANKNKKGDGTKQ